MTSIVVTHDMKNAFHVADRIAYLHEGRIYFHGTAEELRQSHDQLIQDFLVGRSDGRGDWIWETLPFVAVHYGDLTSLVGADGNAVISGHVVTIDEGNVFRNLYRLETLNVGVHAPMMRALQHASYTFAKKISHTADSQDQRHRMVPGSRPLLTLTDTREPDYITPMLLAENPRANELYQRAMHDAWTAKNQLLDRGVPPEIALYVLPNAKAIRLVETGSLLHLLHKWTMRTCFNAQEEIYNASMDEIAQVREVQPELARYVGPPCHLRAGITTPICTEGSHFCGVKVWLEFPNIQRRI